MTQSLGDDLRFDRRGKPRMECTYNALVISILPNGRYFEENATEHNLSIIYFCHNRSTIMTIFLNVVFLYRKIFRNLNFEAIFS